MSEAKPPPSKRAEKGRMIITDGLHFVRAAAKGDPHPMRFIVGQHGQRTLPRNRSLPRYVESLERGIDLMGVYSRKAIAANRRLSATYSVEMVPEKPEPKVRKARKPRPPLRQVPWKTVRFLCVPPVNRIAQTWLCVKDKHEVAGRKARGGTLAPPDELPHEKGQYVVVTKGDPVRKRGVPVVFATIYDAKDKVEELFLAAPPEERLWFGSTKVHENGAYEVHFDPTETEVGRFDEYGGNGVHKPFNIYMPDFALKVRDNRGVILRYGSIEGAIKKADELSADRKRRTRG